MSYSTEASIENSSRTLAQAFASPSYLSSARSYQSLIMYGYPHPVPSLWLLSQNTNDAIFEPWAKHLETRAKELGRHFKISRRTRLEKLHLANGKVDKLTLGRMPISPCTVRGTSRKSSKTWEVDVPGDLILAVPPRALAGLVTWEVAACSPNLEAVRLLRTEPMISLDVYFKRKIAGLTKSITLLLNSKCTLSLLDISQVWTDGPANRTALNVVASNADLIVDYPSEVILDLLLKELQRFLDFKSADVDRKRCHVRPMSAKSFSSTKSAAGAIVPKQPAIFPTFSSPEFLSELYRLVTVEGAVVSGLLAAEALRGKHGIGAPIDIVRPDSYPGVLPRPLRQR